MKRGEGNPRPALLRLCSLLKSLLGALGKGCDEQLVIGGGNEAFGQLGRRRDDERAPLPLDESFSREPTEHQGYRFSGCSDELAEEAIARSAEHDLAVFACERGVVRHTKERRNHALLDAQSRELPQLVEER